MNVRNLIASLFLVLPLLASARSDSTGVEVVRPVLSAYTLELGSANIAQTYLSPLRHTGWVAAFGYERMQAMRFNPERWVMRLAGRLDFARTTNVPAHNATMWNLGLSVDWSMLHRWRLDAWQFYGGGYTSAEAGALYLARNSNNPVAARAAWNLGLAAGAAWNGNMRGIPFCVRYLAQMPLTGIFFAPEYDELYYEIYLGNHRNLIHVAWPGNYFRINNLLTLDLRFGATIVRLGYRCGITSVKASHNIGRHIDHTVVIGIASEWMSLSAKKKEPSKETRIISALY